jgi:type I restriction enzyme, S subunit
VAVPLFDTQPRYFVQLFCTEAYKNVVNIFSRGIVSDRNRLYWEDFKQIPTPFPPADEQAAIVRFLNHANVKIERAIRVKRKLIALLHEQQQAIIYHAVTRGLDASVKLKPSGIPWLGDIPEHWNVMPLRKLVTAGRRITYGILQPGDPDKSGRFMIRGKDYSSGWVSPDSIFRVSSTIETPYTRSRLKTGDIVMTIVGAGVGNVAIIPDWLDGANITQTTARVAINSSLANPAFVKLALQGPVGRRNLERYVYGSAQPRMNLPHVGAFEIPVPPIVEQFAIAESLKGELDRTLAAISRTEREIALLREYRTTLTAEVVTGKLDVREAAKHLPADAEEPLLADEMVDDPEDEFVEGDDNADE